MPKNFTLTGRVVEHHAAPRFVIAFAPCADGGWRATSPKFINSDALDYDADTLAGLMSEAGDFFAAHVRADWVQRRVADRARELGLTAYAIAAACGHAVSQDHVRAYLRGEKSMGSHKLQHVLRVLGLDVTPIS